MGMFVRAVLLDSASLGSPGVDEIRWTAPVRPGDTLTGRSTVDRRAAVVEEPATGDRLHDERGVQPGRRARHAPDRTQLLRATRCLTPKVSDTVGSAPRRAQNAQPVLVRDLRHGLVVVAGLPQSLDEPGQAGDAAELLPARPHRRSPSRTRRGRCPCARRDSRRGARSPLIGVSGTSSPSARRKVTAKLTPTMPPESRIASSCASTRFRDAAQSACAFECVATSGASESAATSQKPASFRCDTSTRMPSRLHARTSSRPAAVSPPPVSGDEGKRNGTPSAKSFGRDHTRPIERSPRSYQRSRFDRSAAIASAPSMCTIAVDVTVAEVVGRRRASDRQRAQRVEQLLGDPRRLLVRNRLRQRHRIRRLGRIGHRRRRDVEREEAAGETRGSGSFEVEMLRRLASPAMQDEVVVPVDDHCRILRAPVTGSRGGRRTASHPDRRRRLATRRARREHPRRRRAFHHRRPRLERRRGGSALRRAPSPTSS